MLDQRRLVDDLSLAHRIADLSDPITLGRFRAQDFVVETKADLTFVSDADREAEDMIRSQIELKRSGDSVLGEERGITGDSPRQWVIDPIDGTNNFIRGVPVWATLIGLVEDGAVVMGLVSAPALGLRWWAAKGHGAHSGTSLGNARALQVSKVSNISDAFLSYSSLGGWADQERAGKFDSLMKSVWRTRAFGDFWSYMLVAEGSVDIAAEPELALYDMAALVPIVEEAGGCFTSVSGEPGPWGGNAVATNALLHEEVLKSLN